jgi:hypothetical protein
MAGGRPGLVRHGCSVAGTSSHLCHPRLCGAAGRAAVTTGGLRVLAFVAPTEADDLAVRSPCRLPCTGAVAANQVSGWTLKAHRRAVIGRRRGDARISPLRASMSPVRTVRGRVRAGG